MALNTGSLVQLGSGFQHADFVKPYLDRRIKNLHSTIAQYGPHTGQGRIALNELFRINPQLGKNALEGIKMRDADMRSQQARGLVEKQMTAPLGSPEYYNIGSKLAGLGNEGLELQSRAINERTRDLSTPTIQQGVQQEVYDIAPVMDMLTTARNIQDLPTRLNYMEETINNPDSGFDDTYKQSWGSTLSRMRDMASTSPSGQALNDSNMSIDEAIKNIKQGIEDKRYKYRYTYGRGGRGSRSNLLNFRPLRSDTVDLELTDGSRVDSATVFVNPDNTVTYLAPNGQVIEPDQVVRRFEIDPSYGQTRGERVDSNIAEATGKKFGTQEATNIIDRLDEALDLKESLPVFNELLTMLEDDRLQTGPIPAAYQNAKRRLGLEDPDFANWHYLAGKRVLSQLRSTFGAAFTEREGERLEQMEAGIGKSSASNIAIIKTAIRMAERAINRAHNIAIDYDRDFYIKQLDLNNIEPPSGVNNLTDEQLLELETLAR